MALRWAALSCAGLSRAALPCPVAAQVMKEMRVKGALMDHKEIKAAMGVKIVGAPSAACCNPACQCPASGRESLRQGRWHASH